MPFHFHLRDPPCDIAFLSLVDGESLFSADGAHTRDMKEATIRQMGWHNVELPQDWFLSRQALDTVRSVLETMQCTIQYLRYCSKNEEKRAEKAKAQLRRCEEERGAAFEELIELRETVALYKHQVRELGRERQRTGSLPSRGPLYGGEGIRYYPQTGSVGRQFPCSFCSNVYPSSHALESHFRKRHKRSETYAAMAAASCAVSLEQQRQQELLETALSPPMATQQASSASPCMTDAPSVSKETADHRGDQSLREEISELRLVVAKLLEQQAELHRGISPACLAAVPQQSTGVGVTAVEPAVGAGSTGPLPGLRQYGTRSREEDILRRLQGELQHTSAQLQRLNRTIDGERSQHESGASDGRDTFPSGHQHQEKHPPHFGVSSEKREIPHLNSGMLHHLTSLAGRGHDEAAASGQRGTAVESSLTLSPFTPPARVVPRQHPVIKHTDETFIPLDQSCMPVDPSAASEAPAGTPRYQQNTLEIQPQSHRPEKLSVSSSSALDLDMGIKQADGVGAALNHGGLTPLSSSSTSHRDSGFANGDRSPVGVNTTVAETSNKETVSREAFEHTRVLPREDSDAAMAQWREKSTWPSTRYGFSLTEESTLQATELHVSAADASREVRVPQEAHAALSIADTGFLLQSVHAAAARAQERAVTAIDAENSLQRYDYLDKREALEPRKQIQRSSSTAKCVAEKERLLFYPPDTATNVRQIRDQLNPDSQVVPAVRGGTMSDVDRPQRSTSPLASRSTQRSQAEVPGSKVASADQNSCRDSGESPSGRLYGVSAPISQSGAPSGPSDAIRRRKMVPVAHLVPEEEASLKSHKISLLNAEKGEPESGRTKKIPPPVASPPPSRGLWEGAQYDTPREKKSVSSGSVYSVKSNIEVSDVKPCSAGIPPLRPSQHDFPSDEAFTIPVDTSTEEASVRREGGTSGPSKLEVLSDRLSNVTPDTAQPSQATRLLSTGHEETGGQAGITPFRSSNQFELADDGQRTPSQAVLTTPESLSVDYSYYSYSYSASEESLSLHAGDPPGFHTDEGQAGVGKTSLVADTAAAPASMSPSHANATRTVHSEEAVAITASTANLDHGCLDVLSQTNRPHEVKDDAKSSADQPQPAIQRKKLPTQLPSSDKQVKGDSSHVKQRHTSPLAALTPKQALKKTKKLFNKIFSKKGS